MRDWVWVEEPGRGRMRSLGIEAEAVAVYMTLFSLGAQIRLAAAVAKMSCIVWGRVGVGSILVGVFQADAVEAISLTSRLIKPSGDSFRSSK